LSAEPVKRSASYPTCAAGASSTGGHFAAMEEPELLAGDLLEFLHEIDT
jgi:hypothetical protein